MSWRRYGLNLLVLTMLHAVSVGVVAGYAWFQWNYLNRGSMYTMSVVPPFVYVSVVGAMIVCPVLAGFPLQLGPRFAASAYFFVYTGALFVVYTLLAGIVGPFAVIAAPPLALLPAVLFAVLTGLLTGGRHGASRPVWTGMP